MNQLRVPNDWIRQARSHHATHIVIVSFEYENKKYEYPIFCSNIQAMSNIKNQFPHYRGFCLHSIKEIIRVQHKFHMVLRPREKLMKPKRFI